MLITDVTERLEAPSQDRRDQLRAQARVGDRDAHTAAVQSLPALNAIEAVDATEHRPPPTQVRIAAWNAERGRYIDDAVRLIETAEADVVLLSEVDDGMARTHQRHVAAELAHRMAGSYAFGVEFVELSSGSAADHRAGGFDPTTPNSRGLHGNAIVSRAGLHRPAVVRLSDDAAWFTDDRGEPRVGGRIAVLATVGPGAGVVVAAVHLESSSAPQERCAQFGRLLDAVDDYAGDLPVVIGGDLNTCTSSPEQLVQPGEWDLLLALDEQRFVHPVSHEPLFELAARRGYEWRTANAPGTTTRYWSGSRRWRYAMRLDWMLTRGLVCTDARTIPAVADGDLDRPLSDHDLLAVTVRPSS